MPEAMLGGIVGAEGSIGQTHPSENKAGGSTQDCQLGEDCGDESLWQHRGRVRGTHWNSGRIRKAALRYL